MNCDQVRELLEAYAAGALDPAQHATVEQHLARCAECRRLADEYAAIVSALPGALSAASPRRPPAPLRARLLDSVRASAARPASPDGKPGRVPAPTPSRRSPSGRRPRTLGGLALSILLALALAWGLQLNVALAEERALRAELADLVGQQEIVFEVVDSDRTVKSVLRAGAADSPSYGKLYRRPDLPDVVVIVARMAPPAPGEAYHLWLGTHEGQTHLGGVISLNEAGFGLLVFKAARSGPDYRSAWVTSQPLGDVTPAGTPILRWDANP